MKNRISIGLALLLSWDAFACSTGYVKESEEKLFVKSYDWHLGSGNITVNKRNVLKSSFLLKSTDTTASWVSKYGSVTFNQHGREFPLGGINEAGLAVEIMMLEESLYPPVDKRGTVNELQWIQYQLDNYGSVSEVLEHVEDIRISKIYAPVHYLVCDKVGECVSVENIQNKVVTHSAEQMPFPALTNDTYSSSLRYLGQFKGFGGEKTLKGGFGSLDRFVRMSDAIVKFPASSLDPVSYGFSMLNRVVAPSTKFQIVYELSNAKVHFKTLHTIAHQKSVQVDSFDFSCSEPVLIHDMNKGKGDLSAHFEIYTPEKNMKSLEKGMVGIVEHLPPGTVERWASYPETTKCLD